MSFFLWRSNSFISALFTAKTKFLSFIFGYRRNSLVFCISLFFFFIFPFFSYANVEGGGTKNAPTLPSNEKTSLENNTSSSNKTGASTKHNDIDGITEESPIDITGSEDTGKRGGYSDEIEMRINSASDTSSYTWNILRLIFSLVFVLFLAYVAIRLMRRGRLFVPNEDAYLKLVASLNIEQGKSIKVFTLGDKAYVIGVTASSVTRIAELEDKVLVDSMNLKADENTEGRPSSFAKVFSNMFSSNRKREQKKLEDVIFDDSFLKGQQERLNNISIKEEKEDGKE